VTQAVVRDREAGHAPKRRDIQGLRALAVVAVVANHLTGHPAGGFVGVDVFFVISGYLITGILLRGLDAQRGPAVYLAAFYRRRARRILPAAVVVIAVTLLAAHSVFETNRFATTRGDAWWSFIFWANWHFVDVKTNYFTASGPISPFEHFWSLAVEEQFYFVWPIVTLLVAFAVGKRLRRVSIAVAAIVIGGASLVLAAAHSVSEPTTTYFSSFTRAWELGVGALLACVPAIRASRPVLTAASWIGTIFIVAAMFGTDPAGVFPLTGVAMACIGGALVIAAGSVRTAWNPLLTNWIAGRIGDLSYSLYLVHFPVIVLLAAAMTDHGADFYTAAILLTLAGSCALYALVERPVLDSNWLCPKDESRDRTSRSSDPVGIKRWVAVAMVCGIAGLVTIGLQPDPNAALAKEYQAINSRPQRTATTLPMQLASLQKQIAIALRATTYPTLHPSMDDATTGDFASRRIIACGRDALAPLSSCTIGPRSATHTIYVTGDSTSAVYAEAFTSMVESMPGWRLIIRSGFGCPFSSAVYQQVDDAQGACGSHNDTVVQEIHRLRPDVLIVTNEFRQQTPVGATTAVSAKAQAADVDRELTEVRSAVGTEVLLAPPPGGADLQDCYRPDASPVHCVVRPSRTWLDLANAERASTKRFDETFIDPRGWFCSPAGYCPAFVAGVPTMYDATHATQAYMRTIAPVMRTTLRRAHVLPA
jgi:peptidoglycan/LPS O-acetylase OafA/YrhL